MNKLIYLALAGIVVAQLQGCAAAVVGGAAVGASVAVDRRTTGVYVSDQEIEVKAMEHLSKAYPQKTDSISATSYNKQVLLTGQVQDDATRSGAVELVKAERVHFEPPQRLVGDLARFRRQHRRVYLGWEIGNENPVNGIADRRPQIGRRIAGADAYEGRDVEIEILGLVYQVSPDLVIFKHLRHARLRAHLVLHPGVIHVHRHNLEPYMDDQEQKKEP